MGNDWAHACLKAQPPSVHFHSQDGTKPYLGIFNIKITALILKVRCFGYFAYHSEWD